MSKSTLVIGASPYPFRYSHRAIHMLQEAGHPVLALGKQEGEIAGIPIQTKQADVETASIDTVSLYLNPRNQLELDQWLVEMKPKRVIFNPGSENPTLEKHLQNKGIPTLRACTLVLLRTGQY
ncbi:MAG: CoA-binding protein [Bacteroidota bacterium]